MRLIILDCPRVCLTATLHSSTVNGPVRILRSSFTIYIPLVNLILEPREKNCKDNENYFKNQPNGCSEASTNQLRQSGSAIKWGTASHRIVVVSKGAVIIHDRGGD